MSRSPASLGVLRDDLYIEPEPWPRIVRPGNAVPSHSSDPSPKRPARSRRQSRVRRSQQRTRAPASGPRKSPRCNRQVRAIPRLHHQTRRPGGHMTELRHRVWRANPTPPGHAYHLTPGIPFSIRDPVIRCVFDARSKCCGIRTGSHRWYFCSFHLSVAATGPSHRWSAPRSGAPSRKAPMGPWHDTMPRER